MPTDCGVVTMTAFISPYREDRDQVRRIMAEGDFVEVYVQCDLAVCEERDTKGLYKKARAGEIREFTGISAPYEAPENAELVVDTSNETVEESAGKVIEFLESRGYLTVD